MNYQQELKLRQSQVPRKSSEWWRCQYQLEEFEEQEQASNARAHVALCKRAGIRHLRPVR